MRNLLQRFTNLFCKRHSEIDSVTPTFNRNDAKIDEQKRYIQQMANIVGHKKQIFHIGTNEKDGNTRCFFTAETHINSDDATIREVEYRLFIERIGYNGDVGHLRFLYVFDREDGKRVYRNQWHIDDFAIAPDLRGWGYGTMMLQSFIDFAKSCGVNVITGTLSFVDEKNFDRSKHLYSKLGFEIDGKNLRCELSNLC